MIAFRLPDSPLARAWRHEIEPRVMLINSHDGAGSYQLHGGAYRFFCSNRMVTGDDLMPAVKVWHMGHDIIGDVIEGSLALAEGMPKMLEMFEAWQGVSVPADVQAAYATSAMALRYDEGEAPVAADALLAPRRRSDLGNNLFKVYNRVQENLIGAGMPKAMVRRTDRSYKQGIRRITAVGEDVRLNRALSQLTNALAQMLGAPVPTAELAGVVIEGER